MKSQSSSAITHSAASSASSQIAKEAAAAKHPLQTSQSFSYISSSQLSRGNNSTQAQSPLHETVKQPSPSVSPSPSHSPSPSSSPSSSPSQSSPSPSPLLHTDTIFSSAAAAAVSRASISSRQHPAQSSDGRCFSATAPAAAKYPHASHTSPAVSATTESAADDWEASGASRCRAAIFSSSTATTTTAAAATTTTAAAATTTTAAAATTTTDYAYVFCAITFSDSTSKSTST
ncbi:uncharacterized protein MONOS_6601 [Monocercomonoides exilis]|uniref:uncharacterized protein n=1 Tax=Monocercomonoides exilis TaxID=2049356 RepID=UPI003559FAD6|nr:hypothetical protein MONOS_6601 [Monocercomonoides exilis]|eukprot:MONOS_6601.1-p1 / transcript=MONOS_6601.1 / gene=MONOS_6601 / organism=Monocercomonoides_exilis_PA203 / gene_product=unspecified product / transcript_product=unspecified product / location=Mono_scaffold00211:4712-6189(-) / protein_length=232 / sequence_SO=supercontig / SO=protein_coding / is_pseudo=false